MTRMCFEVFVDEIESIVLPAAKMFLLEVVVKLKTKVEVVNDCIVVKTY